MEKFVISPPFPQDGGLVFNNTTGEISGTPTAPMSTQMFYIWAVNSGGVLETVIFVTVVDGNTHYLDFVLALCME